MPLAKSSRGTNGTTKLGKIVSSKSGDPRADRAKHSTGIEVTTATKLNRERAAKRGAETRAARAPRSDVSAVAVVRERKSRISGTTVQIINALAPTSPIKLDGESRPWAMRCVEHDHFEQYASRAAARAVTSDPTSWCPKCKRAAKAAK